MVINAIPGNPFDYPETTSLKKWIRAHEGCRTVQGASEREGQDTVLILACQDHKQAIAYDRLCCVK